MDKTSPWIESAALSVRALIAQDGQVFLILEATPADDMTLLNRHMSMCIAVRPSMNSEETQALCTALRVACDGILCIVGPEHALYEAMRKIKPEGIRVQ